MSKKKSAGKTADKVKQKKDQPFWLEKPYLIIFIAAVIVFIRSAGFEFSGVDDDEIIVGHYDKISSFSDIPAALTAQYGFKDSTPYYRPVINLSFLIDASLSGKDPGWFHVSNILFHAVAVSLLFFVLLKFGVDRFAALLTSLIFVVHPIITNAVLWIPGRNDLIASIFCLLSMIYFIKYFAEGNINYLILHSLFYLFGIFSKEVVFVLPAACLAYVFLLERKRITVNIILTLAAAWLIPVAISLVLKSMFVHSIGNVTYGVQAFFDNVRVIPEIIFKIFVPINFSVLPTFSVEKTAIGSVILLLVIFIPFILKKVDWKRYYFGLFWFLLFLLPGLMVVYSNQKEGFDYLDTRAYLPMMGIFLSLGNIFSVYKIEKRPLYWIRFGSIILIILFVLTYLQSNKYRNPEVFAESALESNPERPFFYQKLADYYFKEKDYQNAVVYLKETINRGDNSFNYYKNLALAYMHLNQLQDALKTLESADRINNRDPELLNALIKVSYDLGEYEKCLIYVQRAVSLGGNVNQGFYDSLKKLVAERSNK